MQCHKLMSYRTSSNDLAHVIFILVLSYLKVGNCWDTLKFKMLSVMRRRAVIFTIFWSFLVMTISAQVCFHTIQTRYRKYHFRAFVLTVFRPKKAARLRKTEILLFNIFLIIPVWDSARWASSTSRITFVRPTCAQKAS